MGMFVNPNIFSQALCGSFGSLFNFGNDVYDQFSVSLKPKKNKEKHAVAHNLPKESDQNMVYESDSKGRKIRAIEFVRFDRKR